MMGPQQELERPRQRSEREQVGKVAGVRPFAQQRGRSPS